MVPKMTCRPSKKLSPMMMTVAPPVVQPSLGLMALMQGGDPGWGTQGENDGNPTGGRKEKQPLWLFIGVLMAPGQFITK